MLSKTALNKYNKKDNLLVVSNYPEVVDGRFSNVSGIATYTYHMLPELIAALNEDGKDVVVLAENLKKVESNDKGGFLLYRIWNRGSLNVFKQLYRALVVFTEVDKILWHFEFNMFGGAFVAGLLPFYIFLLRLRGKDVTLLLHQVVENLEELAPHINLSPKSLKFKSISFLLKYYFKLLVSSADKVIVHDDILRNRLRKIVRKPVFVVPHGLGEYKNVCAAIDAREYLRIPKSHFVVLCFGFLTWYKGSDWILDEFVKYFGRTKDKTVRLILAGGRSANLKGQPHYEEFYEKLLKKARLHPNIDITGFVPDDEVKYYYCAADVVALPYRTQMSASGPFAIGVSFDRPFLLSENLKGVLETTDAKRLLKEFELTEEDLTFKLSQKDLFKKIMGLVQNGRKVTKLGKFSNSLSNARQWEKIVHKFLYIIDA